MRSANCSLEFLRRISRRRRSAPNGVESISEYVEHRAALLTPEHLDELRADLPLLNARFAAIAAFLCASLWHHHDPSYRSGGTRAEISCHPQGRTNDSV